MPICTARLAVTFLQSTLRFQADPTPFPFERLPPELRLQVYREALSGVGLSGATRADLITVTPTRLRKKKNLQFRFGGQYVKGESKEINVGLLAANRLVNEEAIAVLYQSRTFDFQTHVTGIEPFLRSVSEQARQNLHGIAMELFDNEEPDHCCGRAQRETWGKASGGNMVAWSKACAYIGEHVNVKALSLTINVKVRADFKTLKWVEDLVTIRRLRFLTLQAKQHFHDARVIRAIYKEGSLTATDGCFSEHLVPLFEYLREEMLD